MKVYGRNVINELLNSPEKIKKVYISSTIKDKNILMHIKDKKVKYELVNNKILDSMVKGNHQGIVAVVDDYKYVDYKTMIGDDIIVILDHLEDPHNFGAIIRTCEAAGIKSIIIPKDRSVNITDTVVKTSTGALEYVNVAVVTNLVNVIKDLKNNGYFVYGAEADGTSSIECNYNNLSVLVIGSEGNGLSRLVRENCDEIISLPMKGHVNSLNASVAAGILIYDMIRKNVK